MSSLTADADRARTVGHVDATRFRRALGQFASGVTVLTTHVPGGVHGMTANAFMSGSLEPPLVVISVARRAKLHGLIQTSGRFGVSILREDQSRHSQHFSGRFRAKDFAPEFSHLAEVPVLKGALAALAATVYQAYECGDHTLFLGRVDEIDLGEGEPLLYFTGRYGSFG